MMKYIEVGGCAYLRVASLLRNDHTLITGGWFAQLLSCSYFSLHFISRFTHKRPLFDNLNVLPACII